MSDTTGQPAKYPGLLRVLHWIMALLILSLIALGWYMTELDKDAVNRGELYSLHKSLGVTVLGLALLRVLTRGTAKVPPMPEGMNRKEYTLAQWVHGAFYVLIVFVPLFGIIMSNAFGHAVQWFGIPLPYLSPKNADIGKMAATMHEWLAYTVLALVTLHVAGVLKHLLIEKINLFRRML